MHPYPRLLSEECIFTDTHPWTINYMHDCLHPHPLTPTSESDVTDKRAQSRLWSVFRSSDPSTGSLQGPGLHALQVPCSPCSTWTHLRAVTCRSTCISLTRTNRLNTEMLQGCWCILSMFAVKRLPGLWFRLWGEFRLWILEFSVQ